MPARTDTASLAIEAAYVLLEEGVHPSVQAVRERIGQGSATTIHAALKDFWAEVGLRLARPDLPEPLVEGVNQLWRAALDQAGASFAEDRQALEQRVQAAEAERAEGLARERELAAEVEALTAARERLLVEQTELKIALDAEQKNRSQAKAERDQAQAALATARSVSEEIKARAKADLDTERTRHEDLERRLTQLYDHEKTAREHLEKLWERAQTAQQAERAEHQQQRRDLTQELAALREKLTGLTTQLGEREAALAGAAEVRKLLQEELAKRETAIEALRVERDRAVQEYRSAIGREIAALRNQNPKLSWPAVAKALNERQILTPEGSGRWTGPKVRSLAGSPQ